MQPFDKIREYTGSVCDQIRWKKAHAAICEELENHIEDQRDTYITDGEEEAAATGHAIEEMGDPVAVGVQLDRMHRPRPQWGMLCIVAALLLTGLAIRLLVLKTEYSVEYGRWTTWWQVASTVLGFGALAAAYFADFTLLGKYPKAVFVIIAAISVALLLLPHRVYGKDMFAEYMTLLFPLGYAALVYAMRNEGYRGIILCEVAFVLLSLITLQIPTTSGFLRFAISGVSALCLANAKGWFNVKKQYGFTLILIPAIVPLWRVGKLLYWSVTLARGVPYPLAGGNLFGPGNPLLLDPETMQIQTNNLDADNILLYMIYKFGWIAFLILMGVLAVFIVKGFRRCLKQKGSLGMMVSATALLTFALQIVAATPLFLHPIGRVFMPFLSYGNTLTVLNAALVGLMLSVFRTGDAVKDRDIVIRKETVGT